jgi:hypothetical protein
MLPKRTRNQLATPEWPRRSGAALQFFSSLLHEKTRPAASTGARRKFATG